MTATKIVRCLLIAYSTKWQRDDLLAYVHVLCIGHGANILVYVLRKEPFGHGANILVCVLRKERFGHGTDFLACVLCVELLILGMELIS